MKTLLLLSALFIPASALARMGNGWVAGAGGGGGASSGLASGASISGCSANDVLYTDPSLSLGCDSDFKFDGTTTTVANWRSTGTIRIGNVLGSESDPFLNIVDGTVASGFFNQSNKTIFNLALADRGTSKFEFDPGSAVFHLMSGISLEFYGAVQGAKNFPIILLGGNFSGFYSPANNKIGVVENQVEITRFTSSGVKVDPTNGSTDPAYPLEVVGVISSSQSYTVPVTTQTVSAGTTITADQCGGTKIVSSTGAFTTDTTNSFTALATTIQCKMTVCNGGASNITVDRNANTYTAAGADAVLLPNSCADFVFDGVRWRQKTSVLAAN